MWQMKLKKFEFFIQLSQFLVQNMPLLLQLKLNSNLYVMPSLFKWKITSLEKLADLLLK